MRTRYYRRLGGSGRILAVRRREDQVWHAERIREDGCVSGWAYAPSLEGALEALGASGDNQRPQTAQPGGGVGAVLGIGGSLRAARDGLGLTLSEVEAATAIPARHLAALEQERFELLPAGLYRRSFLREYAEFLGLDGAIYANEYEQRFAPPEPERPGQRPGIARPRGFGAVSPARAAIVVILALAGIAVWQLGSSNPGVGVKSPPAVTQARTPIKTPASHASRPRHRVSVSPTPSPAPLPALTLTAIQGRCWLLVQVGSSHGPVVYEQTLQQGESVRFGLRRPLWIRLGAPRNLEATIGGRHVTAALPRNTGDVIATTKGLKPAL